MNLIESAKQALEAIPKIPKNELTDIHYNTPLFPLEGIKT